ncbi:hypothetical protein HOD38_06190 [archaeon]|jgi:hypothetical protein|nr:hypothetical protein [archaeon]MBT4397827.1 hypothetical protein [archaeon]MBT4441161.1 hypothetical protein [archaeon]
MKKTIIAAGVLAAMLSAGTVRAEETPEIPVSGSVELMGTHKSTGLDGKIMVDLGEGFGLFGRSLVDLSYGADGVALSDFEILDLTYNLGPNGDAVLEGQFSATGGFASPRVGLQAYGGAGPVSLYGVATMEMNPADLDSGALVELFGTASYSKDLGKVDLSVDAEALLDVGLEGPSYAHQKVRLGLGDDHFEAGAGVNVREINVDGVTVVDVVAGPYVQGKF